MAEFKDKFLENFTGTIGNMIFYQRGGKTFVRSKPAMLKDRQSEAQLAQREKFKLVHEFLAPYKKVLSKTFVDTTGSRTAYQNAFSYNLKNAVSGTYPDYKMDFRKVFLSRGEVALPTQITIKKQDTGFLIEWDTSVNAEACEPDDTFVLIASHNFYPNIHYRFTGIPRSEGHYLWDNNLFEAHSMPDVWVAFRNADETAVSESRYLEFSEL